MFRPPNRHWSHSARQVGRPTNFTGEPPRSGLHQKDNSSAPSYFEICTPLPPGRMVRPSPFLRTGTYRLALQGRDEQRGAHQGLAGPAGRGGTRRPRMEMSTFFRSRPAYIRPKARRGGLNRETLVRRACGPLPPPLAWYLTYAEFKSVFSAHHSPNTRDVISLEL